MHFCLTTYTIENDKLIYKGTDIDFKGNRSQTLINVIQSGIDAKETYTLSLVGNKKEGLIYGELVGDNTITERRDYPLGPPQDSLQTIIYEYNSRNKFQLQQGAISTTKGTGQYIGPVEIKETTVSSTGKSKSANKYFKYENYNVLCNNVTCSLSLQSTRRTIINLYWLSVQGNSK